MRRAAAILKSYAIDAENDISFAFKEAINAAETAKDNFVINLGLAECPYTSWLALLIAVGNLGFNYGEVSENAEILVAKSFIPDAISQSFHLGIKFDSKNNIAFYSGPLVKQKAEYLLELIMSRLDAESQCVTYYEAFPWFLESNNSTNITHAKSNISTLDNHFDEYFIKCKPLLF